MPSCRLRITHCGPMKINVIKALRDATGTSLLEAKRAADSPDNAVVCQMDQQRLERLCDELARLDTNLEVEVDGRVDEYAGHVEAGEGLDVWLREVGPRKIEVIKEVRTLLGCGLKEAKDLVESAPVVVKSAVEPWEAQALLDRLGRAGAVVEMGPSTGAPTETSRATPATPKKKPPDSAPPSGGPAPLPY